MTQLLPGGTSGAWQGAEQVLDYGQPSQERSALATGCGLVDLSARTQIELTGADRARFLHNMCSNDIVNLQPGQGCEAFFLNAKGHTLGHGWIFAREASLIVDTVPGQAETLIAHLDRYIIREDVQLHDRSQDPDWRQLLVAGPQTSTVLGALCSTLPEGTCAHALVEWNDAPVWLRAVPWACVATWSLVGPESVLRHCAEQLMERGAAPCGQVAFDAARLEAAVPVFGLDVVVGNLPQEVDRNAEAIHFRKGCYIGQETVARIDALGHVNKLLRLLRFSSDTLPPPGTELRVQDAKVGEVTSSAFGVLDTSPLALAYVRSAHSTVGTQLLSDLGSAEIIAPSRAP